MLSEGIIKAADLQAQVDELKDLKVSMLRAYESRLFGTQPAAKKIAKKGLAAMQDGHEGQPVVNFDAPRQGKSLTERIASCFTLTKQLDDDGSSDADLRRKYNK
jgi:hypothetical protein